ncbi:MAG: transposase [Flavobacteriales bacterium]|nr:transposase [Flavobacteriales bacterium]
MGPVNVAQAYKQRWQIEILFKRLKQNLKFTDFLGDNENAIRSDLVRLDRGSIGNDRAQIILLQDPASIFNDGGPSAIAFNALCGSKGIVAEP